MPKAKFQRQGTYAPQESEILHAIDERFEELEETIILASLVPQLHERLHVLEQMLKVSSSPLSRLPEVQRPRGKDVLGSKGPQWGDETGSPAKKGAPDDDDDKGANTEEVKVGMGDINDLMALSPVTRKEKKKITEISRSKVAEINEKTLDTETSEYYTFGESTWDLVIFIGTGALGPLGSIQTILLAIVNVLMQVVFCVIAWFNFTSPDINEGSVIDTTRQRPSGATNRLF